MMTVLVARNRQSKTGGVPLSLRIGNREEVEPPPQVPQLVGKADKSAGI